MRCEKLKNRVFFSSPGDFAPMGRCAVVFLQQFFILYADPPTISNSFFPNPDQKKSLTYRERIGSVRAKNSIAEFFMRSAKYRAGSESDLP